MIQNIVYSLKPLAWIASSLEAVRTFPDSARRSIGSQLLRVQRGLEPADWRPMPLVGPGVVEIRVHGGREYRVLYVARFAEAIYVLHAFDKRTRQTRQLDLAVARKRLRDLERWRDT